MVNVTDCIGKSMKLSDAVPPYLTACFPCLKPTDFHRGPVAETTPATSRLVARLSTLLYPHRHPMSPFYWLL